MKISLMKFFLSFAWENNDNKLRSKSKIKGFNIEDKEIISRKTKKRNKWVLKANKN